MRSISALAGVLLLSPACVVVDGAVPRLESTLLASTHYVHRGMTENERGVAQGDVNVDLDTKLGGVLGVSAWANLDLSDEVGDAWFPEGHGGKFTEVDLEASYAQQFSGFDLTAGVEQYVIPNGLEFPNGERGNTTEVFLRAGREIFWQLYPQIELRLDWDEADGYYAHASLARDFPLIDRLHLELRAGLGYSDDGESEWNYGLPEAGLADLSGAATLFYEWDDHTVLHLTVAGSTILDSTLERWFQDIGIRDDVAWIAGGVTFRY